MTWACTAELDISWQHCNRPAYWEGERVFCSKCQEELPEMKECPNHGGAYDCTPFCNICEGNQEFIPEHN